MSDDDAHAAPTDPQPWWPRGSQPDWRELPVAAVDWLVVWNVNLGGGGAAFSVRNRHWGNHPFRPGEVSRTRAWVWHADGLEPPSTWSGVSTFGGIMNRIALTARGVPTGSGTVLLPAADDLEGLIALAAAIDVECARQGGAWCPALVGAAGTPRLGISVQMAALTTVAHDVAERLDIDDVVIVDDFGERTSATPTDPRIVVRGRRNGRDRRARPGREALADVPFPADVEALRPGVARLC